MHEFSDKQKIADQVRTIIQKSWFFDREILEIHQKTDNEKYGNTITDTSSIEKQEQSNRSERPTSESRDTTQPNITEQH